MAQSPRDMPDPGERTMGRRLGMLMAAAGFQHNSDFAVVIGKSGSQIGKYRAGFHLKSSDTIQLLAQALAGEGDLHADWKTIRDFLLLRTPDVPWSPEAISEALHNGRYDEFGQLGLTA